MRSVLVRLHRYMGLTIAGSPTAAVLSPLEPAAVFTR